MRIRDASGILGKCEKMKDKISCVGMFIDSDEPEGCNNCNDGFNAFYNYVFEIGKVRFTIPFCKRCSDKIIKVIHKR